MDNIIKALLVVFIVLYVLLPDPVPGPIDDLIVVIAGVIKTRKMGNVNT